MKIDDNINSLLKIKSVLLIHRKPCFDFHIFNKAGEFILPVYIIEMKGGDIK